jgi:RND family efflux transporter MFP subunit
VDERRSALAKTEVRAPVGGRLGERRVEVGQLVDPSTVLFVVGDLDELIVEVTLTEAVLARVSEGQPVEIAPRAETEPVRATLSRISPFLARESFTTRGEIDADNRDGRLRPGMFVEVRILVGRTDSATLVPVSAVWDNPETGRRGVFVVEESEGLTAGEVTAETEPDPTPRTVAFRAVEILAEGRGEAGVSGVEEGDWVVTVGQHLLGGRTGAEGTVEGAAGATAPSTARVRPVAWERVQALQALQDEDLLEGFLDKQRKLAAAIGAQIPESEDVVDRVLEEAAAAEASRSGGP